MPVITKPLREISQEVQDRFWTKVETENGPDLIGTQCWMWTGTRQQSGYGQLAASCLYQASDVYGSYVSCRLCGWLITIEHHEPDDRRADRHRRPSTYNRKTL